MGFIFEERSSDSPYLESVTRGRTAGDGSTIRPAEIHWHMVLANHQGHTQLLHVGPWTSAGTVTFTAGVELLWIKFKLGTFLPHFPSRTFVDTETALPGATSQAFWLKGAAWQFPDYENVETFVEWLVRDEVLVYDEIVHAALHDQALAMSPRTLRHRFLQSTGMTQSHIRQFIRAQHAAALLQQGASILDTAYAAGYYDQPHLTRSLKHFIGHTPGELVETNARG